MARSFGSPIPRTSLPNLRVNQGLLTRLASPGAATSIGKSIGASLLGAERRGREAEDRLTEEATIELLRRGQLAKESGDMRLFDEIGADLQGMLGDTKSSKARNTITTGLASLNNSRAATQKQAQTNLAMGIINTEQALENFDQQMGPLSDQQLIAQKALKDRLLQMRQNGAAVVEANTIRYNADVQALERSAKLREERVKAATDVLASLDPNSDEYQTAVDNLNNANLGKAVRNDVTARQEIAKANGEIREQQLKTGRLTDEEMAAAKEMGLSIKDRNAPLSRKIFNAAMEERIKQEVKIALQPISTPEQNRAEALAKATLNIIARQGDFFDVPFYRDVSTKIEDMSDEQTADLMGRIAGLAEEQIPNEVTAWLNENFPKEMARSRRFAEKNKMEAEDIGRLANSILADQGINAVDATEEQIEAAKQQARIALEAAESAFQRQEPDPGGEGRRSRRGPVEVAEPYTFDRKTGTGGQMSRQQK